MSKSRIMGAGTAGSTIHNCNVNLNTAGGSKKQGFPFTLGSPTINRLTYFGLLKFIFGNVYHYYHRYCMDWI